MYYIGFDLGDGESSLSYYNTETPSVLPVTIPVCHSRTVTTAVAVMKETGETVIGNNAATDAPNLEHLRVCFKRDFITGAKDVYESYRRFISGIIAELKKTELPFDPLNRNECRFVVGQPADWSKATLDQYRVLLESCGIHDPYMISESRAALVFCNTAKYMRVCDPAVSNTLVCDFGSSTLDFAFSVKGDSSNVAIFGDPRLGGGLMDEQIVLESIDMIENETQRRAVRTLFDTQKDIRARMMMTARKLKEQFFLDPDMTPLKKNVLLLRPEAKTAVISIDTGIIERVIMYPHPLLDNRSIYEQLQEQFARAAKITKENPPEIILLTGGASRMGFFRDICRETFQKNRPEIVFSEEPETDIANGLALDGSYAEKLSRLKDRMQDYVNGPYVEKIIEERFPALTRSIADGTVNAMLSDDPQKTGVLRAAFRRWRGETSASSMDDMKQTIETYIKDYCGTSAFSKTIEEIVSNWMDEVLPQIQSDLDRICTDLGVSPAHASLRKIKLGESISINGTVFRPGTTIVDIMDTIVTGISALIVGALAGGGGIALISSGLVGIVIGILAVVVARFALGRRPREAVMRVKLPGGVRKLISENTVFNEKSVREMKFTFADLLSRQDTMKNEICKTLSAHVDAVILAVSSQTKV